MYRNKKNSLHMAKIVFSGGSCLRRFQIYSYTTMFRFIVNVQNVVISAWFQPAVRSPGFSLP